MEYNGKKALVCGMARSGIAAAKLLNRLGARVTLQDMKKREEISADVLALEGEGIVLYTGANPDEIACAQDLIVLSPGIPCDLPFIAAAEEAGIEVISEVELAYRLTPCPITAITGTNGKTTTTTLTGEIMKTAYSGTAVVGNIGIPYSEEVERLTEKDWVVAEISSFQMEKAKEFHPHISAVLNITPDHLNRHKTMDVYIAMKERVFAKQTAGFLYSEPWGRDLQKNGGQNRGEGVFLRFLRNACRRYLSGRGCHRGALGRYQRNPDSCG